MADFRDRTEVTRLHFPTTADLRDRTEVTRLHFPTTAEFSYGLASHRSDPEGSS